MACRSAGSRTQSAGLGARFARGVRSRVKSSAGSVDDFGEPCPRSRAFLASLDSFSRLRGPPDDTARVPPGAERASRCPRTRGRASVKGKLVIGLVTAGLFLAGFGGAVLPASAEPHHYLLKLANGTTIPYTGEPGTAPSTITVAGVPIAVISVQDLGAVVQQVTPPPTPAPTPTTAAPAPTTTTQPSTTQPKAPAKQSTTPKSTAPKSSAPQAKKPEKKASAEPTGSGATQQPTSGHTSTKPQASPETSKKTKKTTAKTDKP